MPKSSSSSFGRRLTHFLGFAVAGVCDWFLLMALAKILEARYI